MSRHRFDPSSVAAAVLFLAVAGLYLADGLGRVRPPFLWTVPAALMVITITVLLRIAFRSRRRDT